MMLIFPNTIYINIYRNAISRFIPDIVNIKCKHNSSLFSERFCKIIICYKFGNKQFSGTIC